MRGYAATAVLATLSAAACRPSGEVLLYVDTDAPVAAGPSDDDDDGNRIALFDRIRIDVYRAGEETPARSNDLALTRGLLAARDASFGIVPRSGEDGDRARIRIYRFENTTDGEPDDRTVLEAVIRIPAVAGDELLTGHVFFPTDAVGRPRGTLAAPIALEPGRPTESRVGTWSPAQRVGCGEDPAGDEAVCVPGGAFWMGHPSVRGNLGGEDVPVPKLVAVSPFFLDRRELTVGDARQWLRAHEPQWTNGNDAPDPVPWSGKPALAADALGADDYCTMPPDLDDDRRDALPLNCVSYERATAICQSRDPEHPAALPTEAQLEYAMGSFSGWPHPWAEDVAPSCDDAVFARGGSASIFRAFPGDCRAPGSNGGVLPGGRGALDVIAPFGVVDLAGNLAELARDGWSEQRGPFWSPETATVFIDPLCCDDAAERDHVVRGGSWPWPARTLHSAFRAQIEARFDAAASNADTKLGPHVGFRCVRAAMSQQP